MKLYRFDRYIVWELMVPTMLATSLALLFLLGNRLLKIAPVIVQSGVPAQPFFQALGYLVPAFLVTAVPIALYMSTLVVSARLVRTGEWGALLAAGHAPWRATLPFVLVSLVLAGSAEYAIWTINPQGRVQFGKTVARLIASNAHHTIAPGAVHVLPEGVQVYLAGRDNGAWIEPTLLVPPSSSSEEPVLIHAGRAEVSFLAEADSWQFRFLDGWMYSGARQPWVHYGTLEVETNPFGSVGRTWASVKESTWSQLQDLIQRETPLARAAIAEVHNRVILAVLFFFLPLSAVALGVGSGNARHGRGESLLQGLAVFGFFYIATTMGRKIGMSWPGPVWVPMWGAAACLVAFCLWRYRRILVR